MSTAILVLGMHRSGTSALTGALHLLGVPLGGPLLPAGPDNERGFWELEEVAEAHEELLRAFGASHLDLAPLPEGWREHPAAQRAAARLRKTLGRNFAGAPLWAVKDPRLSILLPLWDELLAELGAGPRFLLAHRSPWEVARSLAVRNGTRPAAALALWERHTTDAERLTRGRRRAFASYDRFLSDPLAELERIGEALGVEWPVRPADAAEELRAFLSPSLRHWKEVRPGDGVAPELVAAADAAAAAADGLARKEETQAGLDALERTSAALRTLAAPAAPGRRVLFVSHDASRTGAPLMLLRLARWLRDHKGLEPRFVLRAGGPLEPDFRETGETLLARDGTLDPRATDGVSLVWANTATSGPFLAGLSRDDLPVVTHVHELAYALESFGRAGLPFLLARTTRFVACSEAVAAHLVGREGVAPSKVTVLHEAVDAAALAALSSPAHRRSLRAELGLPEDALVVLGAGTADWRKGADLFLQVARAITEKRADVAFVWVGGTSAPVEEQRLRHDLATLGTPPRIRFLGERADPIPAFDAADVFLLPSREDPFPIVMLEAAALGKPCVCFTGSGGAPELCGEGGVVVPYLDLAAMTRAVENLLDDPARRRTLGEAARTLVRERFDITRLGERANALIEELAIDPQAATPRGAVTLVRTEDGAGLEAALAELAGAATPRVLFTRSLPDALRRLADAAPAGSEDPRFADPAALAPGADPRPLTDFRLAWIGVDVPERAAPGALVPVRVAVRNTGGETWHDAASLPGAGGRGAVRLGWRWRDASGAPAGDDRGRVELPFGVPPDASVVLHARVVAPAAPGRYTLQLDLVQELVSWFEPMGAPRLEVPVAVEG